MNKIFRRKNIVKVLTVLSVLLCTITLSMPGIKAITANEVSSKSITISGVADSDTLKAYKIININYDYTQEVDQPTNPMYTWDSNVAGWLKLNDSYKDMVGNKNEVKGEIADLLPAEQKTFLEALATAIEGGDIANLTVINANEKVFTNLSMGEYLVLASDTDASDGTTVYLPTSFTLEPNYVDDSWQLVVTGLAGNVIGNTITMKSELETTIKKTVDDPTVKLGATVNYTLQVAVPDFPTNAAASILEVVDAPKTGLEFNGVATVKVYTDSAKTNELNATGNYTVKVEGEGFKIEFTPEYLKGDTTDATLYITYTATVTDTAYTTANKFDNTATLTYNPDPYSEEKTTKTANASVYTFGLNIDKVGSTGTQITDNQAVFGLKDGAGNEIKFVNNGDGQYSVSDELTASAELKTYASGNISINGLDEGTYTLTEVKAPDGYVKPSDTFTITLTDTNKDGKLDDVSSVVGTGASATLNGDPDIGRVDNGNDVDLHMLYFDVINLTSDEVKFNLPQTGGMGTVIFTVGGIALMAGSAIFLVMSKKKEEKA